MKAKYIIFSFFAFSLIQSTEAQLLKKIKKRAEEAAKETIIRKVEEKATEKTEKAMDTILNADKNIKKKKRKNKSKNNEIEEEEKKYSNSGSDTISTTKTTRTPNVNPLMGSGKTSAKNLPETYTFNWEFKTNMKTTGKKKSQNSDYVMNFLLNTDQDYYAMDVENEDIKKSGGKAIIVFDFKSEAMVMFSSYGSQKIGMFNKLKDPEKKTISDKDRNYTFKEIGAKTILGYQCYGMEVENKNSLVTLYFTLDAPVNFSAFFAFSSEAAPKGFSDPQLFDVLKEDALLMEMQMTSKNKKQTITMTAISLKEKNTEFHKKEYQFMKMGF